MSPFLRYANTWDTRAAMHRVWAAAKDAPIRSFVPVASTVSPACMACLDGMMACDEEQRPTASACLAFPWMCQPLPAGHEAALARAAERQLAAEALHSASPPRRLGGRKTAPGEWRDAQMRAFVGRAVKPGVKGEAAESMPLLCGPAEDSSRGGLGGRTASGASAVEAEEGEEAEVAPAEVEAAAEKEAGSGTK